MRPFAYRRADSPRMAVETAGAGDAGSAFLAGGTTLLDLMKLEVMQPSTVVDIGALAPDYSRIELHPDGLHLGALTRMAAAAEHPEILKQYPVIAQSLQLAASAQLRNMATLGGNVLQRTRCNYFRDPLSACNKRQPASGCPARDGVNRKHAVLGVSESCIATYPGDFAQALVALDASVELTGPDGNRTILFETLHVEPGTTPQVETLLQPGELIKGFFVPAGAWARRSLYLKVRDRQSYEFGLASAAVALDMKDGMVTEPRIALGGVATKPWRAREAERFLRGKKLDEAAANGAAQLAFATAAPRPGNAFKVELGRRTLVRALLQASTMEA